MNKPLACHYSVVRFCPYPETDEFVNVGVVLACPTTGYFDFKRAGLHHLGRVGRFFPELGVNIYASALSAWEESLKDSRNIPTDGKMLTDSDCQNLRAIFKIITRPREAILLYSSPRVIMSDNPATTLDELFGAYVEPRVASVPKYQEQPV